MTLSFWRFYFRAWRAPWGTVEITLQYTPKYKGPFYKTSVKMFDLKEKGDG